MFAQLILTEFYDKKELCKMRFEDLDVRRKSVMLCSEIYKALNCKSDFAFINQITRSALSISSNIAEGFERESDKECIRFLMYSKGSCGELRSQIYIGMNIDYFNKAQGEDWLIRATEISNMLAGLIKTKRKYINTKQSK
jgi:four helix bundle protein